MDEKNKSEKNHGGRRAGAGRKPKNNARTNSVALSLSDKALASLDRLVIEQGSNRNDVINRLLEELADKQA